MRNIFGRYKFTNKKHPTTGILSVVLALVSGIGLLAAILTTYKAGGNASFRMGSVCFMALVMAVAGEALGIIGLKRPQRFTIFPIIGMIANVFIVLSILRIVYAGVVVL